MSDNKINFIAISIMLILPIILAIWAEQPDVSRTVKTVDKTWEFGIVFEEPVSPDSCSDRPHNKCRCTGGSKPTFQKCFKKIDSVINRGNHKTKPSYPKTDKNRSLNVLGFRKQLHQRRYEHYRVRFLDLSTNEKFSHPLTGRKEYNSFKIGSEWKITFNNYGAISERSAL